MEETDKEFPMRRFFQFAHYANAKLKDMTQKVDVSVLKIDEMMAEPEGGGGGNPAVGLAI